MHIPVRNSVLMAPVSSLPSRYGELSGRGQDIFEGVGGLAGQLRDGVAHLSGVAVGAGASVLREELNEAVDEPVAESGASECGPSCGVGHVHVLDAPAQPR